MNLATFIQTAVPELCDDQSALLVDLGQLHLRVVVGLFKVRTQRFKMNSPAAHLPFAGTS